MFLASSEPAGRIATALERWLVLQGEIDENHGLDTHEHGDNGRFMRLPFCFRGTGPGAEEREADFAIGVKIRVEADLALTCGDELENRGLEGIVLAADDVELEESALVGRAFRSND